MSLTAAQYSATYAPWSMSRLPPAASPSSAAAYILALEQCHTSASAPTQVQHFGRTLSLVPPPASHAAIRSFFIRTQTEPQRAGLFGFTPTGGFGPLRDTTSTKAPMPTLQSELYDLDFQRLLRCHNPRSSLGLPKQTFSGLVAGAWEGRFSFFDFDSCVPTPPLSSEVHDGEFSAQLPRNASRKDAKPLRRSVWRSTSSLAHLRKERLPSLFPLRSLRSTRRTRYRCPLRRYFFSSYPQ